MKNDDDFSDPLQWDLEDEDRWMERKREEREKEFDAYNDRVLDSPDWEEDDYNVFADKDGLCEYCGGLGILDMDETRPRVCRDCGGTGKSS